MHALIDLSEYGVLCVSGRDAAVLLQGQLTCHIPELTLLRQGLAAQCNPKGQVISFFRLFYIAEQYYLFLPRSMLAIASAALKKYAVFYQVSMTDVSTQLTYVGELDSVNAEPNPLLLQDEAERASFVISAHPTRYLHFNLLGKKSCEFMGITAQDALLPSSYWRQHDIMAGIPNIYPLTSRMFWPHELNLLKLRAISLNKGCYTGQEVIARMHYRGQVKKGLYLVQLNDGLPALGCPIYSQEENRQKVAGAILDYCPVRGGRRGEGIGLMVVQHAAIHTQLFLKEQDDRTVLLVSPLHS